MRIKRLLADDFAADICYRNLMSDAEWANLSRPYFEYLIDVSIDVLDKKFLNEIKSNVHGCFAEVYLVSVCRERLKLKVSHPSDRGLDFYLNDFNCWIECVSPTSGILGNPNSIPASEIGMVRSFPERSFLLRMASAFSDKSKKIRNDLEKGVIETDQPVVLFISAGALEDGCAFYPYPKLFDVLLGIGEVSLHIDLNSSNVTRAEAKERVVVEKTGAKDNINIGYFYNTENSHISAVIYSWANFANPFEFEHLGRDFHLIHNPYAKNKLPLGIFSCGREYVVQTDGDIDSLKLHHIFDRDFE